jgi:hypothetical protein
VAVAVTVAVENGVGMSVAVTVEVEVGVHTSAGQDVFVGVGVLVGVFVGVGVHTLAGHSVGVGVGGPATPTNAKLCLSPALMAVTPLSPAGMVHCPKLTPQPQATTVPSLFSARL